MGGVAPGAKSGSCHHNKGPGEGTVKLRDVNMFWKQSPHRSSGLGERNTDTPQTMAWLERGGEEIHSSFLPCSGFLLPPTGQMQQMSEGKKARVVAAIRGTSGPPGCRAQQRRAEGGSMKWGWQTRKTYTAMSVTRVIFQ